MTHPHNANSGSGRRLENCRRVEVRGQVRGVQMDPPGDGDDEVGGVFELLLENGDIIVSPYPAKWHLEVAGDFQANDLITAVVSGIGEYSPDGRLLRIREIETYGTLWNGESHPPVVRRI